MAHAKSFRDLDVYRLLLKEAERIFALTKDFPKEEMYALADQIRRSSRAVSAIIAEGWMRRRYEAAFVNTMNQAMAEANETSAWLDHARVCDYIDEEMHDDLDDAWQHVGVMLNRMIQHADTFCRQRADAEQVL